MELGSTAKDYLGSGKNPGLSEPLREVVGGDSQVRVVQLSGNSIRVELSRVILKDPSVVKLGLITFLRRQFPNYKIQSEKSTTPWSFIISYYPLIELPPDMLRKVFIHTGPVQTLRLLREIPELEETFCGEHFWYQAIIEQYPRFRKIPKDSVNWAQFCQELALLSEGSILSFELPMLKRAVERSATETVKVMLQDSRVDLPSIRAQPSPVNVWWGFFCHQILRKPLWKDSELILREEMDPQNNRIIGNILHSHRELLSTSEVGKTAHYTLEGNPIAVLWMANAGSFKVPDPVLILWNKEYLFVYSE